MCFFVLTLIIYVLGKVYVRGDIDIDNDHLKLEPECGRLPSEASSRISNSQESEQHFPWVVFVQRRNRALVLPPYYVDKPCGGTIITKHSVITAAHCICGPKHDSFIYTPPDFLEQLYCVGGRSNVKPNAKSLPNEARPGINEIRVEAGNRNWTASEEHDPLAKSFLITYAYVHNEYEHGRLEEPDSTVDGPIVDIAILKTNPNELEFYTDDSINGNFAIGPICLVAEGKSLYDKVIETVGWGTTYEEERNAQSDPKPFRHSCTTNTHGPIAHILQHCDVDYLKRNQWTCDTVRQQKSVLDFFTYLRFELNIASGKEFDDYTENHMKDYEGNLHHYPAGYNPDECLKLWNNADQAVRSAPEFPDILNEWDDAKEIDIGYYEKDDKNYGTKLNTCYKDELFKDRGWCYLQGRIREKFWGFCDYSCDDMHRRNELLLPHEPDYKNYYFHPDIHHKMKWKIDPSKSEHFCFSDPQDHAQWIVCPTSILPTIKTHKFHMNDDGSLTFKGIERKNQNEYAPRHAGFIQGCPGDSGSGHWIFNSNEERHVFVGVFYGRDETKNWCGYPSAVSKLTHEKIHSWIKLHALIFDTSMPPPINSRNE